MFFETTFKIYSSAFKLIYKQNESYNKLNTSSSGIKSSWTILSS